MNTRGSFAVWGLICAVCAACDARSAAPEDAEAELVSQALEPQRACTDSLESVYGNPTAAARSTSGRKGDIVRCAQGETLSVAAIRSALAGTGIADPNSAYPNVQVRNAVRIYRLSYRTQRAGGRADLSSALVALPQRARILSGTEVEGTGGETTEQVETDRVAEADFNRRAPLIVYGHGTVPYGQTCAYSRSSPLTAQVFGAPDLELRTVVALAAQGWPVIMPDYAGFVAGSPVAGYMYAQDEAYSVLDATRAMQQLLGQTRDQVVLVGHSQGGHAVLAAQSYARAYGMSGRLAGVVAFAPFWAPARTFGVILGGYSAANPNDWYPLGTAIEYFYTHLELYDGPGAGKRLFVTGKLWPKLFEIALVGP